MERVLIAGCGDVGSRLGKLLVRRGDQVFGLKRRPETLPDGLDPVAADLTDPDTLGTLPANLTLVVYAASADERSDAAYRRAYVDGLRNLLDVLRARRQEPRRLLFTSSTGVYGQRDGSRVDESSATEPQSFTGRRLLEAEDLVARSPFPGTSLRLGGIYGPGRTRLIERVRSGDATCPEGAPLYTNRIHSDDAAAALVHLAMIPDPEPVYLGVDQKPADLCEVLRYLAQRLEAAPPRTVPAEEMSGRSSKRCSSRLLFDSGFRFRYPTYREGYAALIREMEREAESAG